MKSEGPTKKPLVETKKTANANGAFPLAVLLSEPLVKMDLHRRFSYQNCQ